MKRIMFYVNFAYIAAYYQYCTKLKFKVLTALITI